nr:hypothetical protein [Actinomyces polynesiensis]
MVFEHHLQLHDRVLTGGVLLECPADQRRADGIDVDGVDEASIEVLAGVEVAELGAADRPAPFDLVSHLDLDVFPAHADLEFVDDVGDRLHRVAHIPVAEVLFGRDQLDPLIAQAAFDDGRVEVVAEDAGAHVDDDVLHVGGSVDEAQQLLELWTLLDRLRRLPGFDELAQHRRA